MQDLSLIEKQALEELEAIQQLPALDQWKSLHLGKKSPLMAQLKGLKDATPEERKALGMQSNTIKKNSNLSMGKQERNH